MVGPTPEAAVRVFWALHTQLRSVYSKNTGLSVGDRLAKECTCNGLVRNNRYWNKLHEGCVSSAAATLDCRFTRWAAREMTKFTSFLALVVRPPLERTPDAAGTTREIPREIMRMTLDG